MSTSASDHQVASMTIEQAIRQAVEHHRAGRLQDAERFYRAVLSAQPNHADANHNLGVLAMQVKKPELGLPHLKMAIEANPNLEQFWVSYVDALGQAGQFEAAKSALDQGQQRGFSGDGFTALVARWAPTGSNGLDREPSDDKEPPSMSNQRPVTDTQASNGSSRHTRKVGAFKGNEPGHKAMNEVLACFSSGNFEDAARAAQRLTEKFPSHPFGWKLLGAAYGQMGRAAQALAPMQKAATLTPRDASIYNNLGNIFRDLTRLGEAQASFEAALKINPKLAAVHYNLGSVHKDCGRIEEAENCFRRALDLNPDYADASNNLGVILSRLNKLQEAEACFRSVLKLNPQSITAYRNIGNLLKVRKSWDEAEVCFRTALELSPSDLGIHFDYANLMAESGKIDQAVEQYRFCLDRDPSDAFGAQLMLSRLGFGQIPDRTSLAQIDKLYIERASGWDNTRGYRGHELVAAPIREFGTTKTLDILDAGCGTGLAGELLRDVARKLDGVDMSEAMLNRARDKAIYGRLHRGDMVAFMNDNANAYDAIACAATLIHFGDLLEPLKAAAETLRDGGLMVFTVFPHEAEFEGQGVAICKEVALASGGCFAHGRNYLRMTAEASHFFVEFMRSEIHEYDQKRNPVNCLVVGLRRVDRSV